MTDGECTRTILRLIGIYALGAGIAFWGQWTNSPPNEPGVDWRHWTIWKPELLTPAGRWWGRIAAVWTYAFFILVFWIGRSNGC